MQMDSSVFGLYVFFGLLLAGAMGSFANVLIYRLPIMIVANDKQADEKLAGDLPMASSNQTFNIATPASFCPHCHAPLKWWQNIPLISYVVLRGRCAECRATIPLRYLWVELGCVLLALLCIWVDGVSVRSVVGFVFLYLLWVLSWIDALHYLLPDALTLSLLLLGFVLRVALSPFAWFDAVTEGALGALLGYMILWLPYALYLRWRGIAGLGLGDCKLMAGIGVWLGVVNIPTVLMLACAGALVCALVWAWRAQCSARNLKIPFGPFLAAGAALMWFFGRNGSGII